VTWLEEQGWLTFHRHRTGQDLVVFRAPEFIMSELTSDLAAILDGLVDTDMGEAVAQLAASHAGCSRSRTYSVCEQSSAQALLGKCGVRAGALP